MALNQYPLNTRTLNGPYILQVIEYPDELAATLDQWVVYREYADQLAATLAQNVVPWEMIADSQAAAIEQTVAAHYPDVAAAVLDQTVESDTAPPPQPGVTVAPPVYVYLDGVYQQCRIRLDTLSVRHTEDGNSTASLVLMYERDAPIMIPSLNGMTLRIDVPADRTDPASPTWPLFTGWVERSQYSRDQRAVQITGTDLRAERIGDEDPDDLLQLTQAVYSEVTQRQDATGQDFVTEMMRTVSGSLGYNRGGDLYYYDWDIGGSPVDITLDGCIRDDNVSVEYQTRSKIVNAVDIKFAYRYHALRTVKSEIEGRKHQRDWADENGSGTFLRDSVIDRVQTGYKPWLATEYEIYDFYSAQEVRSVLGENVIYVPAVSRCVGFRASMSRYIVQPVTEQYSLRVEAPQSIRAYGKVITGSDLSFGVDSEYERADFEDREAEYNPTTKSQPSWYLSWPSGGTLKKFSDPDGEATYSIDTTDGGSIPVVDGKRPLVTAGMRAATLMAQKQIKKSHRQNYVEVKLPRLLELDIGAVVSLSTAVISATGRCTGLDYRVSSQGLETRVKIQISSMPDSGSAPVEDWTAPPVNELDIPADKIEIRAPRTTTPNGSINYNLEERSLDVSTPDIPEVYTDEGVTEVTQVYETALENYPITLINSW